MIFVDIENLFVLPLGMLSMRTTSSPKSERLGWLLRTSKHVLMTRFYILQVGCDFFCVCLYKYCNLFMLLILNTFFITKTALMIRHDDV